MAVLIPLKAGGNIQGHCDLNDIFLSKEEKFVENLWSFTNKWKKTKFKSEAAIRSDILYSFYQGNMIVIRENSANLNLSLWQP